jgi:hypothetical protein
MRAYIIQCDDDRPCKECLTRYADWSWNPCFTEILTDISLKFGIHNLPCEPVTKGANNCAETGDRATFETLFSEYPKTEVSLLSDISPQPPSDFEVGDFDRRISAKILISLYAEMLHKFFKFITVELPQIYSTVESSLGSATGHRVHSIEGFDKSFPFPEMESLLLGHLELLWQFGQQFLEEGFEGVKRHRFPSC